MNGEALRSIGASSMARSWGSGIMLEAGILVSVSADTAGSIVEEVDAALLWPQLWGVARH
jgi:hypothetical protein